MPLSQRQRAVIAYEQSYGREPSAGWTTKPRQQDRQIALRLAKLEASCERLRPYFESQRRAEKRKRHEALNARARKLLSKPERRIEPSGDPLDMQIADQIRCQHEQYRPRLRQVYSAFVAHNEEYWGGGLTLPIITVEPQLPGNAQATCQATERDCVIRFDHHQFTTRPLSDVVDILLHEEIHAGLVQLTGGDKADGKHGWHHSRFRDVANRIAKARGWESCCEKITTGRKAAQYWPPRTHY